MNTKATQERHQRILMELVRQPGNDICADCRGRAPRWASWNLGIFLCVQCAGVHRKMGTHISKVKSLTLDTWTREQVDKMKEIGNVKSNQNYNPDETRNRPPTNIQETERDSELEKFIRAKYEYRKFIDSKPPPVPSKDASTFRLPASASASSLGPISSTARGSIGATTVSSDSRRRAVERDSMLGVLGNALSKAGSISRSRTAPIPSTWAEAQARARSTEPQPPMSAGPTASKVSTAAAASSSLAPPSSVPSRASSAVPNARSVSMQVAPTSTSSVFDDLISLSGPSTSTPQPPPQMNPWSHLQAQNSLVSSPAIQDATNNFWASSSASPLGAMQPQAAGGASSLGAAAFARPQPPQLQQHASTLPNFAFTTPDGQQHASLQLQPQQTAMFGASLGASSTTLPFQPMRSVSLGSMAFSTSALASPVGGSAGSMGSNPFLSCSHGVGVGGGGGGGGGLVAMQSTGMGMGMGTASNFFASGPSSSAAGVGMGMTTPSSVPASASASAQLGTFASSMMPQSQAAAQMQNSQNQFHFQQQQAQATFAGQQAFGQGGAGASWS
ncbi:Protein gts1 [Thecaphora frezii]